MMRIALRAALVAIVALGALGRIAHAQARVHAPTIVAAYDSDTEAPLKGADVRDSLTGVRAITGEDGRATLRDLTPVGPFYLLEVRKIGYQPLRLRVLAADLVDEHAIVLAAMTRDVPGVATLPAVVATATVIARTSKTMQAFEIRRRSVALRGKFVPPEELRTKFAGASLNDVLLVKSLKPIARGCSVAYFVDGVRWSDGISGKDPERIPLQANSYEAMEFYPSALMAPADIIGSVAFDVGLCGVYVLWLREP